jgi:GPH family glycoside/pentoside/hexuronide:cation symporter
LLISTKYPDENGHSNTMLPKQGETMNTASASPSLDQSGRLKVRERIAYGLGDFGSNMAWTMVSTFLLFFYTDVFGISAAVVGTLFLINRIWDGINDPIVGFLADRTRSKFGTYRPFLLYLSVPFGICLALMFTTPDISITGKIIWVYVTYFAMELIYTLVNVPYGALLASITDNQQERAKLSSARFIGLSFAILIVSGATPGFIAGFSSPQTGYQVTATIFGVIAVISFLLCFAGTKERNQTGQEEKVSIKEAWSALIINRPLVIVLISLFLMFTGFTIQNMTILHYFKYILNLDAMAGIYFAAFAIFGIVGASLTPMIIKKLDKRTTVIIGFSIYAVAGIFWFLAGNKLPVAIIAAGVGGFGQMMVAVSLIAMIADTVEYSIWKTGVRVAGTINALSVMVTKFSTAIGGATGAFILASVNYVPNIVQPSPVLNAMQGMVTYIPSISALIGLVVISFYTLDRNTVEKIIQENLSRATSR